MVITWYGLSCFKITFGELALVTDPFSKTLGLAAPRFRADIAIISNISNPTYNNQESLSGDNTFVIDGPGEFDVKGLFVQGIAARGGIKSQNDGFDYTTIYAIRMEDIRLGFLGSLKQKELTDGQLEALGEIDILFIPVGGRLVCDAEEAVTIVNQIEPHIVIPMHYAQKGLGLELDKVEQFLKEIGQAKASPEEKLTIKKSGFEELKETTKVVVLSPQR
jgi:L-ascorbate metabolism protein UlaG (beta-lactamase superfamily)